LINKVKEENEKIFANKKQHHVAILYHPDNCPASLQQFIIKASVGQRPGKTFIGYFS